MEERLKQLKDDVQCSEEEALNKAMKKEDGKSALSSRKRPPGATSF